MQETEGRAGILADGISGADSGRKSGAKTEWTRRRRFDGATARLPHSTPPSVHRRGAQLVRMVGCVRDQEPEFIPEGRRLAQSTALRRQASRQEQGLLEDLRRWATRSQVHRVYRE